MNLPSYYSSSKWKKLRNTTLPLNKKLEERINMVKKQVASMSTAEKLKAWEEEPYWEVSKIIMESEDFSFSL